MAIDASDSEGEEIELSEEEGGNEESSSGSEGGLSKPVLFGIIGGAAAILLIGLIVLIILLIPAKITCDPEKEGYYRVLVDPPFVDYVNPPLTCSFYDDIDLWIHGSSFVLYNDEMFNVTADGFLLERSSDLMGSDLGLGCSEVSVRFLNLPPAHNVDVEDPEDIFECFWEGDHLLARIPPPEVEDLFPPAVCLGEPHSLVFSGKWFFKVDGVQEDLEIFLLDYFYGGYIDENTSLSLPLVPNITVGENRSSANFSFDAWLSEGANQVVTLSDCNDIYVDRMNVTNCSTLTLDVSPSDIDQFLDLNEAVVTNPKPAHCYGKELIANSFRVVPKPSIFRAVPPVVCAYESDVEVVIHGSDFLMIDGILPAAYMDGVEVVVLDSSDCTPLEVGPRHTLSTCNQLRIVVPRENTTAIHWPNLFIELPFITQCNDESNQVITIVPPPIISDMTPRAYCADEDFVVDLFGDHFLVINGTPPSVHIPTRNFSFTLDVITPLNCTDHFSHHTTLQNCTRLSINATGLDITSLWLGLQRITVSNPPPVSCYSIESEFSTVVDSYFDNVTNTTVYTTVNDDIYFLVVEKPEITHSYPPALCVDSSARTTSIYGTNFFAIRDVPPSFFLEGYGRLTLLDYSPLPHSGLNCSADHPYMLPQVVRCLGFEVEIPADSSLSAPIFPDLTIELPLWSTLCSHVTNQTLALTPPPTITDSYPLAFCAGSDDILSISGENIFLFDNTPPNVFTDTPAHEFLVVDGIGCVDLGLAGSFTVEICPQLDVYINASQTTSRWDTSSGPLTVDLMVENPDPIGCFGDEVIPRAMFVVPPVIPVLFLPFEGVCLSQSPQDIELTFPPVGFLSRDNSFPDVDFAGLNLTSTLTSAFSQCNQVFPTDPSISPPLFLCTDPVTMTIPVDASLSAPNLGTLTVTHPLAYGCASTVEIPVFPAPSITELQFPALCQVNDTQTLIFAGTNLFTHPLNSPSMLLPGFSGTIVDVRLADCSPLYPNVSQCNLVEVDVLRNSSTGQGSFEITAFYTNPSPYDCDDSSYTVNLTMIAEPEVYSGAPEIICGLQSTPSIDLSGSFSQLGSATPSVFLFSSTANVTTLGSLFNCALDTCSNLDFTMPPSLFGPIDVAVRLSCLSDLALEVFFGIDAPVIDYISPPALCINYSAPIILNGTNFLEVDGQLPLVFLNGFEFTPTQGFGCSSFMGRGDLRLCDSIEVFVPAYFFNAGFVTVEVTNLNGSSCSHVGAGDLFEIVPVPIISNFQPDRYCLDQGADITLTGIDFYRDAIVYLWHPVHGRRDPTRNFTIHDSTTITFTMDPYLVPSGLWDVVVHNILCPGDVPCGCSDQLSNATRVHPIVLPFFVDPPTVYNGINTQVTVYTSGLLNSAAQIILTHNTTGSTLFYVPANSSHDPGEPNRIRVVIPSGSDAGSWDVTVISEIGCTGISNDVLVITDNLVINLEAISPPFGWVGARTAVTITANLTSPEPFKPVPRVYLSPVNASGGTNALLLRAVRFTDTHTLTALILPNQTAPGTYDMIVVNPDGGVGTLEGGYEAVSSPTPVIDSCSPGSLRAGGSFDITVLGRNFDPNGVTLQLDCETFIPPKDYCSQSVTVNTRTATQVDGSIASFASGCGTSPDRCLLKLTNIADQTYALYPLGVVPPSLKPPANAIWTSESLLQARKNAALFGVPVTASENYLMIAGGDTDGTVPPGQVPSNTLLSSIEYAKLGFDGTLSSFSYQVNELPLGLTASDVVMIGRYVYLFGGQDPTGPTADIYRALILDPLLTPSIRLDVNAQPGNQTHVSGIWSYLVSAYFNDTYLPNPGGETLPGEPIVVQLPSVDAQVSLILTWDQVAGAAGYNIYRTDQVNSDGQDIGLLTTITGGNVLSFLDPACGIESVNQTKKPLPFGSLGVWSRVGGMSRMRYGLAVAATTDPADPNSFFIYIGGGLDQADSFGDDWESLGVTISQYEDPNSLDVQWHTSPVPKASGTLRSGGVRAFHQARAFSSLEISYLLNTESYVTFFGGRDSNAPVGHNMIIDTTFVPPTTGNANFIADGQPARDIEGYCYFSAGGIARIQGGYDKNGFYGAGSASKGTLNDINASNEVFSGWAVTGAGEGELPSDLAWMGCTQFLAFAFTAGGIEDPAGLSDRLSYAPT